MPSPLIDRRAPRRGPQVEFYVDEDEGRESGPDQGEGEDEGPRPYPRLWESLGFAPAAYRCGSPQLSDHASAVLLIQAAALKLAASMPVARSSSTRRWKTSSGPRSRTIVAPSRSRRHGAQHDPGRNILAYLRLSVLGLSYAELGRSLGLSKSGARHAVAAGRRAALRAVAAGGLSP